MEPRQTILDIFSTFLSFNNSVVSGWIVDGRLRRNMQTCLQPENRKDPTDFTGAGGGSLESSEAFWALYWHRIWQLADNSQRERLAMSHLAAYLQEVGYWSARKLALNLASAQAISDFFQIAMMRLQNILKGFNPQMGTGLKNYAGFAFSNAIKDTLRLRQEVDICTDWALLHKVSQKRLIQSLENFGIGVGTIPSYVLAWQCFKSLHAPNPQMGTRKLVQPDESTLSAIVDLYHRDAPSLRSIPLRDRVDHLDITALPATPERMTQWLTTCGQAVRAYLYPKVISASTPKPHTETGEFLDDFESTFQDSVLTSMIDREETSNRQSQSAALDRVLLLSLLKLDVQSQRLLQLYYGQGATQQEIAQQLATKQYTVSRRLTSIRQNLLKTIADWSHTTLHQSPTTNVLSDISILLEEWLTVHYTKGN